MIFDTHAHYDDEAFDSDRDSLLQSMNKEGIELIINPGCDLKSCLKSISISEKYPFVYSAVGVHPEEVDYVTDTDLDEILKLLEHPKCVAVGEIGLDYYWNKSNKNAQIRMFQLQMEWADEYQKPVIVHDREAHGDSLNIIKQYPNVAGVFHCYSGSVEMAEELIARGWYLGFDGPITYKNNKKQIEVLNYCPIDRMLIETDSPYLSPTPMRGRRNDSRNLSYIIDRICEVKSISKEEVEKRTMTNGKCLFGID